MLYPLTEPNTPQKDFGFQRIGILGFHVCDGTAAIPAFAIGGRSHPKQTEKRLSLAWQISATPGSLLFKLQALPSK